MRVALCLGAVLALLVTDCCTAADSLSTAQYTSVVERRARLYQVTLDLAPQVIQLDIMPEYGWMEDRNQRLAEVELAPTPFEAKGSAPFVSASILAQKAKQFDDGLYAAVELAAQNGAGRFAGKARLLQSLCTALAARSPGTSDGAASLILAAARTGNPRVSIAKSFDAQV